MEMILAGVDCENCEYSSINDHDKARVKVYCAVRGKEYYYGQCIPCEDNFCISINTF